jgi:DsrC like protein/DsrE/DsrF/DrsH-like family
MPTATIAGVDVAVNEEGFLEQPDQWTEDMAVEIAKQEGIEPLTPQHWQVINFMRKEYFEKGTGADGARARQDVGRLGQGALPTLPQGALPTLPQGAGQARGEDRRDPEAPRLHLTRRDDSDVGQHREGVNRDLEGIARGRLSRIGDTGAGMYACKASVDMFGSSKDDFVDQIQDIITVGEFYENAAGGQIIFT